MNTQHLVYEYLYRTLYVTTGIVLTLPRLPVVFVSIWIKKKKKNLYQSSIGEKEILLPHQSSSQFQNPGDAFNITFPIWSSHSSFNIITPHIWIVLHGLKAFSICFFQNSSELGRTSAFNINSKEKMILRTYYEADTVLLFQTIKIRRGGGIRIMSLYYCKVSNFLPWLWVIPSFLASHLAEYVGLKT